MAKNDDGFNLDDMMEIFGETAELPAKKEEASSRPAVATQEAPRKEAESSEISDDEAAILAAYEKSKKEQKSREEEAKRKKDEEARKILEQYEKELRESKEREARLRRELEERQKKELEELKKKQESAAAINKEEEERRIIEEFERQAREQQQKEEAAKQAKEEKAQAELKALAEKQKAEESARQVEEAKREAEFKAKAAAQIGDKKESRLMELLAKAQKDIESSAPAPLPAAAPATAASSTPAGASVKDILIDIEQKENDSFIHMLDETRKSMFTFLAPMIGIKAANNMLNKTVEKARAKAPVLLKDANWKMDGSLREDGSVDPERTLSNVQKIPVATRVDDFVQGLHALVDMRIKAVEVGLGAKASLDMKMKLSDLRRSFSEKGYKPEWVDIFYSHVIG
jgi:hypothetical protein